MKFDGQIFTDETINLDGNEFQGCTFNNCHIIYAGGMTSLGANNFGTSRFSFAGAAGLTLKFMTAMYHDGAKQLIEGTFDVIRKGVVSDNDSFNGRFVH